MDASLFAIYEGPGSATAELAGMLRDRPLHWLKSLDAGIDLDLFVPEPGDNAAFNDGAGPAAMLEFSTADRRRLAALVRDGDFKRHFHDLPAELVPPSGMSFGIFRALETPVAGAKAPAPRTAGLSFFVRYYGPMPDEKGFQTFYTKNHPPILARFPSIRNVLCYLPVDGIPAGLPVSTIRLGNEVVFDDLDHLNAALRSDVLADLRADSARFPPFGHSTHHAMNREKLSKLAR